MNALLAERVVVITKGEDAAITRNGYRNSLPDSNRAIDRYLNVITDFVNPSLHGQR